MNNFPLDKLVNLCYIIYMMNEDKKKLELAEITFEGWTRDEDETYVSDLDIRDRD